MHIKYSAEGLKQSENKMDIPCKKCVLLAICLPRFRHIYFSCSCEILEQYLGCVREESTYEDYNYKNLAEVGKWYKEKTGERL